MAVIVPNEVWTEVVIQSDYDWDCPSTGECNMRITLTDASTFTIKRQYQNDMTNSFSISQYRNDVTKVEMWHDMGGDITLLGT